LLCAVKSNQSTQPSQALSREVGKLRPTPKNNNKTTTTTKQQQKQKQPQQQQQQKQKQQRRFLCASDHGSGAY
jgi:hypothetical protein